VSEPTSITDEKVCFGELEIFLLKNDNAKDYWHRDDVLYMQKTPGYIHGYEKIKSDLGERCTKNIVEIGIFRGGSGPFFIGFSTHAG